MASTINNTPEIRVKSAISNPALYSLGFLGLLGIVAFLLLQFLPYLWYNVLKYPATSTSNITLAIIGFTLGIVL